MLRKYNIYDKNNVFKIITYLVVIRNNILIAGTSDLISYLKLVHFTYYLLLLCSF